MAKQKKETAKKDGSDIFEKIKDLKGIFWKIGEKEKKEFPEFMVAEPRHLIVMPAMLDPTQIDIRYPLLEPFAYTRIKWEPTKKEPLYNITEPILDEEDRILYSKIVKGLLEIVDVELSKIKNPEEARNYIEAQVQKVIIEYGLQLKPEKYLKLMYYIYRNFVGLNEIEPLMQDPYIEDIGCDGVSVPIYIVHRKFGTIRTNIIFNELEALRDFVVKLAERCGRYISYAEPLLDGTLPSGSRIQATLAGDVTTRGPTFSIRKFTEEPFSPVDILNINTASSEVLAYLWLAIESNASMLICGGVATGKTTFLNTISMFIPPEAKIISIEDTRELQLPHDNWIPSVARTGFGIPTEAGKYGEVTMFDLLKESFRQNPDYVIVGEVRGKEAYVMFQGMASGHACVGTMHAGKVEDVIYRLETPPIEISPSLIETLDMIIIMVHAREKGKSARRVKEIVEIESVDPTTGTARTNKVFTWIPTSDSFERLSNSWVIQKISRLKGTSIEELNAELLKRKKVLDWMKRSGTAHYKKVAEILSEYHKSPAKILKMAGV